MKKTFIFLVYVLLVPLLLTANSFTYQNTTFTMVKKGVVNNSAQNPMITKAVTSSGQGYVITNKGAWCWFADPRALHYENAAGTINCSYIGYIDVHGNIKATQHNFITGKTNEVLIRSYFQPDDHNNPSFLVLPDERIMIFYSRHTDEACFYYRVSKQPGDITALGEELKITTGHNTTYPSPFILSDDPNHIYLCWRGINWHPTIGRLTIPDVNDKVDFDWGPYQMVQSTGARPYCKYYSNGKDKIFLAYTTGHPDNEFPNYLYFNYIDINARQLKDVNGTILSTIANGPHNVNKTTYPASYPNAVVDNPTDQRDWVWQTALDKDGFPVIAMVQISSDKTSHNYYYAKWTGTNWRKTFLANGGGHFHQTAGLELCYSGGMAIDDSNPDIVYCSVPISGTSGNKYEIVKYTIGADGSITSSQQLTSNSAFNNVRPYVVTNSGNNPLKLVWMHGNYYDWIVSSSRPLGYPTAIHGDFNLHTDSVNLNDGLIVNEDFTSSVLGTAHTTGGVLVSTKNTQAFIPVQSVPAFSVSLTPYIYEGSYDGTIIKMGKICYSLNGVSVKPYVRIDDTTYNSVNLLGTSDVWQTQPRGTGGAWYSPTKLKYFNLTLTYENGVLRIYRNGLIDQVISVSGILSDTICLGGFNGWIEDCRVYNRALNQGEIKMLTETSLSYTFNNNLTTEIELECLTIPQNIYTDVLLAVKSASGNNVIWASNNTSVISNTGIVTLPQMQTNVTLTATINSQSKIFNVKVWPRDINKNQVFKYTFETGDVYQNNNVKYIRDHSGNSNDAIIYGSAQVDGALNLTANTAASFSTNGFVMAPVGIINNLRSFSFLARINPSSLTGSPRIFDFGSASSNSFFLRASAYTAGYKYNGGTTTLINSSVNLTSGQEAKVAITFNAATKTTIIYLNGSQTVSSTSITYEPHQLTAIGANNRNYIGRTQWWDTSVASSNIDFNGTMDDIFFYDIALTAAEIAQVQSGATYTALNEKNPVYLYPNPVMRHSNFYLNYSFPQHLTNDLQVVITSILGEKVQVSRLIQSPVLIEGLKQGMYIVRIESGAKNVFTGKLMVN